MKFSEKIMSWLLPMVFVLITEKHISTDSIRLEYGGAQDKPIPTIVFYIDSLDKTGLFRYSYRSYKLKKNCLESMEKKIQEFDSAYKTKDPNSVGYYNFIITKDGIKTKYITLNKLNSRHLIYMLIMEIKDTAMRRKAHDKFNDISQKMW